MKQFISIILSGVFMLLVSCSDFLDTENYVQKNSSNFPKTADDMYSSLLSSYAAMAEVRAGSQWQSFFIISEVMSDDRFGGGAISDVPSKAINHFKKNGDNMYSVMWARYYKAIHRANFVIEKEAKVNWTDEATRNKIVGQAYFLRGLLYFDLARLFGNVPLILSVNVENTPKAETEPLYRQIFSDFTTAIKMLPSTKIAAIPQAEFGLATKWSAEAFLGRAYLFYSGYYGKETITLTDNSVLNKSVVIAHLEDCIQNSGHNLIDDFRNLWPYAYSNKDYGYAKNNNLKWIGEDGKNTETVFAIKYSALGSWGDLLSYSNQINLYFGLRMQDQIPFGRGWGWGTVNPQLYESWPDNDIRKKGSVYNVNDPAEGVTGFVAATANVSQETGYFQKKYMPINVYDAVGKKTSYGTVLHNATNNFQLNNTQDLVLMRFSDVLLMAAELGAANAQGYLDRVRSRVGLSSVPVTLDNIKQERKFELAFEAVRYYDLLRWKDAEKEINKIVNVSAYDAGVLKPITRKFRPETGGFLPIPQNEIDLSDGVLEQNPGWIGPESYY